MPVFRSRSLSHVQQTLCAGAVLLLAVASAACAPADDSGSSVAGATRDPAELSEQDPSGPLLKPDCTLEWREVQRGAEVGREAYSEADRRKIYLRALEVRGSVLGQLQITLPHPEASRNPVGPGNLEKWAIVDSARATEALAIERAEVYKLMIGFGISCVDLQSIFLEGTEREWVLDAER